MTEVWSEDGEKRIVVRWHGMQRLAGEHDKNRNGSQLVSVDAITLIYAKLRRPAAC